MELIELLLLCGVAIVGGLVILVVRIGTVRQTTYLRFAIARFLAATSRATCVCGQPWCLSGWTSSERIHVAEAGAIYI